MVVENLTWGAPRIHGELLMLGFDLCEKLSSFGKFSVRHKPGILRKIGYTGETIQTKMRRKIKFISLGALRQRERVE